MEGSRSSFLGEAVVLRPSIQVRRPCSGPSACGILKGVASRLQGTLRAQSSRLLRAGGGVGLPGGWGFLCRRELCRSSAQAWPLLWGGAGHSPLYRGVQTQQSPRRLGVTVAVQSLSL